MPKGGHFAALEQPDLLLDDMRKFFAKVGSEISRNCALMRNGTGRPQSGRDTLNARGWADVFKRGMSLLPAVVSSRPA
jgi:hypothetical protein